MRTFILIIIILTGCTQNDSDTHNSINSGQTPKDVSQKQIPSEGSKEKETGPSKPQDPPEEPEIEYPDCDESFQSAFTKSLALSTDKSIQPLSAQDPLSKIFDENKIIMALAKEFSLKDDYQKISDSTYEKCVEMRKTDSKRKCDNIMENDIYLESVASWIALDTSLADFEKSYTALTQIRDPKEFRHAQTIINSLNSKYKKADDSSLFTGKGRALTTAARLEILKIINNVNSDEVLSLQDNDQENLNTYYNFNREQIENESSKIDLTNFNKKVELISSSLNKTLSSDSEVKNLSIDWTNVTGRRFKDGEFALTYDDGPKASTTNELLDYLSSSEVKRELGYRPHATFFWLATNAIRSSNRNVIEKAKSLGYGLASHSYSHENFRSFVSNGKLKWCSKDDKGRDISLKKELISSKKVLEKAYGQRLNYFRLPYGSGFKEKPLQDIISSLNMVHFFWNVNADDWRWRSVNPKTIEKNYIREIYKARKGVILLHDIQSNTTGPLTKAIIKYFGDNDEGFKIVPLESATMKTVIKVPANSEL